MYITYKVNKFDEIHARNLFRNLRDAGNKIYDVIIIIKKEKQSKNIACINLAIDFHSHRK